MSNTTQTKSGKSAEMVKQAEVEVKLDALGMPTEIPDFSQWTEEETGFPPFWKAKPGAWFFGRVVRKEDATDRTFARYMIQAGMDTDTRRGGSDEEWDDDLSDEENEQRDTSEKIVTKKGRFFSISVFSSLEPLFDFYLEAGNPWIRVTATKKIKTKHKEGRKVWNWSVQTSPKDRQRLDTMRAQFEARRMKELAASSGTQQLSE